MEGGNDVGTRVGATLAGIVGDLLGRWEGAGDDGIGVGAVVGIREVGIGMGGMVGDIVGIREVGVGVGGMLGGRVGDRDVGIDVGTILGAVDNSEVGIGVGDSDGDCDWTIGGCVTGSNVTQKFKGSSIVLDMTSADSGLKPSDPSLKLASMMKFGGSLEVKSCEAPRLCPNSCARINAEPAMSGNKKLIDSTPYTKSDPQGPGVQEHPRFGPNRSPVKRCT